MSTLPERVRLLADLLGSPADAADLRAAADLIDRLETGTPKTADGVPVTHNMLLFYWRDSWDEDREVIDSGHAYLLGPFNGVDHDNVRCSDCYSTQAAAEAAREGTK
jgi:hypothetical protein